MGAPRSVVVDIKTKIIKIVKAAYVKATFTVTV